MRVKDDKKLENIMDATIKLVNTIGIQNTSMSKIAKEAGISASTIYVYFENKEDMINEIYFYLKEKMVKGILSNVDLSGEIQDIMKALWYNSFFHMKNNYSHFVFCEQLSNTPVIDEEITKKVEGFFMPIFHLIEKGKKDEKLKNVDTQLIVLMFYSPIMAMSKYIFTGKLQISESELENVFEMFWDAIKK